MFHVARVRASLFASPTRIEDSCIESGRIESGRIESGRADGATVPATRDLRIDLIRGLALWMIFIDHVPGNPLAHITYGHFALADALDIFIFLSGISCGLLYGRLIRDSVVHAGARALRRAAQLYVGNLFLVLVTVACFFAFRHVITAQYVYDYDLGLLDIAPRRAIAAMIKLLYMPQMTDILPLYMALVLATPAIVWLMRWETIALSAGLWVAAAAMPQLTVPSLGGSGVVPLNPFSWQFLFCIGLWAGKLHFVDGVRFEPNRWLLAVCWLAVGAGFIARHAGWFVTDPTMLGWIADADTNAYIHPWRLLNLLAAAYVVATYLRADAGWLRSGWASALRLCGRHSLEAFCAGVAVSVPASIAVVAYGPRLSVEAVATVAGFVAMIAVAWVRDRGRARSRHAVDVAPETRRRRARAGT